MASAVFEFQDYKRYLAGRLSTRGASRGLRAKLAGALGCQGAYVSQVLNGATHFSLEHAVEIDRFLAHGPEESRYFMLLVHHGRAGTKALRDYYFRQMDEIQKRRQIVTERIQVGKPLPRELALTYYQAWYYSAIHVLMLVPRYQTRPAIAERLGLAPATVAEAVELLIQAGLVQESRGRLKALNRRLHLGEDSISLSKHHLNWRLQALHSLDRRSEGGLHYSGPMVLTEENGTKLKALLLNAIEEAERIIARPGEEDAFCLALDFFRL